MLTSIEVQNMPTDNIGVGLYIRVVALKLACRVIRKTLKELKSHVSTEEWHQLKREQRRWQKLHTQVERRYAVRLHRFPENRRVEVAGVDYCGGGCKPTEYWRNLTRFERLTY